MALWGSLQVKFGLSYIAVIAAVLLLLNTYPLLVSEDLVFRSKETNMTGSVSVVVYSLAGLNRLNQENVAAAMAVVEETGLSRVLVTDSAGLVLYDTRETNDALGEYSFYTEIVQALLGNDVFSSSYRGGAFRSRAASPVLYQNQIIGAVYAYEYDTEQAALLESKGFRWAFPLRCLPREVSRNLWSQAEFDSVTARKLCELRERFYPDTVQFPPEQMAVVLTDLYTRGATIVSSEKGYGIYFRREDTLYFVELMAEDDRSAEVLMEAAREKEVIVERAVITVGAAQNLFLGEGTRQDYGMIRFDAEPFDVEESYMRLMMES